MITLSILVRCRLICSYDYLVHTRPLSSNLLDQGRKCLLYALALGVHNVFQIGLGMLGDSDIMMALFTARDQHVVLQVDFGP